MKTTQQQILHFCRINNLECPPIFRLLDVTSELGEVAKEFLKITAYGKINGIQKTEALEFELADALFSLLALANSLDIDLETSLAKVIKKYEDRITKHDTPGSR